MASVAPSWTSTLKIQVSTTNIDVLRFGPGRVSEGVSEMVTGVSADVTLKNGA